MRPGHRPAAGTAHPRSVALGEGVDDGESGAASADRDARIGPATHDDDAVDLLRQQRGDDLALALGVVAHVAEEDEDLGRAQRVFDAGDDRHVEASEIVGGDQTDGERAAAEQTLDEVVGAELETLSGAEDALARLHPQPAATVERLRGRAD